MLFPPWFLAQKPDNCILTASHSDTLAETFGRRARNLVEGNSTVLGMHLRSDSKAAGEWETSNGGRFFCAGVGTKIAGHRSNLALIDDPIGKKEDADSKLIRDKIWNWYLWDFKPRLKPNGAIVLIQTRWHEDDLAGRILQAEGNDWTVISVPLIAEQSDPLGRSPGEPLWPEYFTQKMIEDAMASPAFVPLYQQRPTPESGDFFKAQWLREYGDEVDLPEDLRFYIGSDHAVSQKQEADRTCILVVGVDRHDDLWVLPDCYWGRGDTGEVVEEMLRLARIYRPHFWWAGREHITASIGPFIEKRSFEESIFIPFEETPNTRDKRTKAHAIRGMMKFGRVHFPSFAPWWAEAKNEILRFDKGTHDDFVDALSELGRGLEKMTGPRPRPRQIEPQNSPILTLGWIKESHRRKELAERLATIDV